MSRWRPTATGNLYVLPDLHGKAEELQLILDRILPLRNDKNAVDQIVFLGDYVDRGKDTPGVIDKLISLKQKFGEQVVLLRGNHEQMMLSICGKTNPSFTDLSLPSDYSLWINNWGSETIIKYAARKGVEIKQPKTLTQARAISLLDADHMNFLQKHTVLYHETDNYIFVHAGCEPNIPLHEQDEEILLWDRSLYGVVKNMVSLGQELPWNKTIITGHNYDGPFINSKFMMLDASAKDRLLVVELNSMEAYYASSGKERLVKYHLQETRFKPPAFRRASE